MKLQKTISAVAFVVCLTISTSLSLAAQNTAATNTNTKHHHYKLVDLGTFGGSQSSVPGVFYEIDGGTAGAQVISNQGVVTGSADTSIPDPLCFFDDCFYPHTFRWQDGVVSDLGALPGGQFSGPNWISGNGLIAGISTNGETDPLLGFPEGRAVLWQGNSILDLGTLPGGYESFAFGVNDGGQVVGSATNGTPDPYSYYYGQIFGISNGTQTRAFVWDNHNGMRDLGTLGGPDAWAAFVNEQGQVAGISLTSFTPNPDNGPTCAANVPSQDPFLWEAGTGMIDLGTFGGTCGAPQAINNRGQVVGGSYLSGNTIVHAFLWDKTGNPQLKDLGTLGGDNAVALWIDNPGDVVGYADIPHPPGCNGVGCVHHAFLWQRGRMTDLGTIGADPCSRGLSVNSRRQVVGATAAVCGSFLTHGFLWEGGGPAVDLNALISATDLALTIPLNINDRGEIAGTGFLPNGNAHAFLLIPCDDDVEGCDYSMVDANTATTTVPAALAPKVASPFVQGSPALRGPMNPMLRRFGPRFGPWNRGMGAERPALKPTSAPPAGMTRQTTTEDAPEPERSPETIPSASSDLQVDDLISARDRAEVVAGFGLTSDAAKPQLVCPAAPVYCPTLVQGSLCGCFLCFHAQLCGWYVGYDPKLKRNCHYIRPHCP